jgi:MoxR-like ATPase
MTEFRILQGNEEPHDVEPWPVAPPWRQFKGEARERHIPPEEGGSTFRVHEKLVDLINAAIHLRRPLLVTGKPGTGKSSLARAIAYRLRLGRLLTWPINSRSTRQEGLYHYDAIGRLQAASMGSRSGQGGASQVPDIGRYIRLGPLGTALLPADKPRVLLIDEIDKSDIDLPNDLLHIFEEGQFDIPEIARETEASVLVRPAAGDGEDEIKITQGRVMCAEFPIVVLTSNGEREFPAAFNRRCIRVDMPDPSREELEQIILAHFCGGFGAKDAVDAETRRIVSTYYERKSEGDIATDQLLNAVRICLSDIDPETRDMVVRAVLRPLSSPG